MDDSHPLPPRLAALAADLPMDALAFDPVPVKGRHDGWTPGRQRGFIQRLVLSGGVGASAAAIGMSARSAYRLRGRPGAESFAAAWDKALRWGIDSRLEHALERALVGETRGVFYKGRKCGERVHFDNGLTIAVLNMTARKRAGSASPERDRRILNDFLASNPRPL